MVQSVRFDAAAEFYSAGAATGITGAHTIAFWAMIDVDRGYYSTFWSIDAAGGYNTILTSTDGTQMYWAGNLGSVNPSANPLSNFTVGQWYYVAGVHEGGTSTNDKIYWSVGAGTMQSHTGDINTPSASWTMYVGGSGFSDEWLDGRVAQVRVWTAALSQAELEAERTSPTVVRTSGLYAFWSFASGPQTADESGNGHTLSGGTGATSASGPPDVIETPSTLITYHPTRSTLVF